MAFTMKQVYSRELKPRNYYLFLVMALLAGNNISWTFGQAQTVNIMLFYERTDSVKSFDAALEYIKSKPDLQITVGEVYRIMVEGPNATTLITRVCKEIDTAYAQNETGKQPDIILDFTRHGIPSETVKMLTKVMTLPTISGTFGQPGDIKSWENLKDDEKNYLIQIAPPADIVPQVARSIASLQGMRTAALLFDDSYEMNHKYKPLFLSLPTRNLLLPLKQSVSNLRRDLNKIVQVDIVNFFVAASPSEISSVLAEASDPEIRDGPYVTDEFSWYSISMEPGLPTCAGCKEKVSLIHISPKFEGGDGDRRNFLISKGIIKNPTLMDFFYFDLTMNAFTAVAKMKASGKWDAPPYRVCRDQTEFNYDYTLNLLDELKSPEISKGNTLGPFHFDSEKTPGKSYAKVDMIIRRLHYNPGEQNPSAEVAMGTWRSGFGKEELIETPGKEDQWKAHMAVTTFRVVTVVQPPFVYKLPNCHEPRDGAYNKCFRGLSIDLLDRMQQEFKFNYTIRNVSKYGYMEENMPHQWTGVIRELKDRKADIAIGALSVLPERENVVDFTEPFYDLVGVSILMRKPKVPTSLFKFLTVLENDVWMCILGAYFFTSFLMWVFDRWSPYSYQNNLEKYEDDEEKRIFNLKECLWFCMTSLTPQGGGEAPKNLSGRLVAATWWLFGFIIIASYTANLAAFLTVSRLDAPIESLDDLAKQYKIQYAPMEGSAAWTYFDRMAHVEHRFYEIWKDMSLNDSMTDFERSQLAVWDYPVSDKFTKMWQAMMENNPPKSFDEAVTRVRGKEGKGNDGFAFVDESTNIRYQTLISCDFMEIGEEFSRKPYAIAVQKGSPLKEAFSELILQLHNERYIEKLKEIWWADNPYKATCPKDDSLSDGISIHNIGGVFIVIFVGVILACFSVLIEYCWYRRGSSKGGGSLVEQAIPPPKEFGQEFSTEKTNFSTQYNKPAGSDLPTIENSW